jgi:ankyrin repeat protein
MLASFLNNFDTVNFLLENGSDLHIKNTNGLSAVDEIIRNDHKELFECIYDRVKYVKRDLTSHGSFGFIHIAAG